MYATLKQIIKLRSPQIFLIASVILMTLVTTVLCMGLLMRFEVVSEIASLDSISYWSVDIPIEQQQWYDKGIEELRKALHVRVQKNVAKNLVVFVVRGVGSDALAAARFTGFPAENEDMIWDTFPHHGRLKNTCSRFDNCDAFTQGTALFGGVKTNFHMGGVDSSVAYRNCSQAANSVHHVPSIMQQAQASDKRTALITTNRLTAPSVASLYARTPDTSWECDAPSEECQDVAFQLVHGSVGINLNVVFGGGLQTLMAVNATTSKDHIDAITCSAAEKRNLLSDWRVEQLSRERKFAVVQQRNDLRQLAGSSVDYVLGVFGNSNMNGIDKNMPDLEEMIAKSFEVLNRNDSNGFAMLIDSSVSDEINISTKAEELGVLNRTLNELNRIITDDTLFIILFSDGAYKLNSDGATEPNDWLAYVEDEQKLAARLKEMPADSLVFAKGPGAYLLHGVHEETYMAHLIAYALRMGHFKNEATNK